MKSLDRFGCLHENSALRNGVWLIVILIVVASHGAILILLHLAFGHFRSARFMLDDSVARKADNS